VNPLLADKPAAPEQPQTASSPTTASAAAAANGNGSPYGAMQPPLGPQRACKSCGEALAEDQEWCLQCGAGAPGSLMREADWRPLAALAAAGAILLGGAATAAYAALSQQPSKPPTHVLIAQVPASTVPSTPTAPPSTLNTPPPTSTPSTTTPSGAFGTSTSGSSTGLPPSTIKPPRLPAIVPTPHNPSALTPTNTGSTPAGESSTPVKTPTTGATEPTSPAPNPIVLDTDAASTYNPSGYPESYFGDPGLAIDGETGTAWTAQVPPGVAPKMAAGLALDLKTARHLGTLELHTSTPGMTLEVFGANGSTIPPTIVDPAWKKLTASHLVKKKDATIKLGAGGKAYRFLVLWFIQAPASAVGTPAAPGHISIGEVVPFPPGG
jgi:hypothetical protein